MTLSAAPSPALPPMVAARFTSTWVRSGAGQVIHGDFVSAAQCVEDHVLRVVQVHDDVARCRA